MTTKTASRKQTEIAQPVVFRCTSKITNAVFYLVRSDSDLNTWYELHWNDERRQWQCNCPATKPCKHERAVSQVCHERQQYQPVKPAGIEKFFAPVEPRMSYEAYCQTFDPCGLNL